MGAHSGTPGTLEGPITASPGDVIIRGVQGEFYPCKPDIFAETYDKVPDPMASGGQLHKMGPRPTISRP